jgi:hypothetical protein
MRTLATLALAALALPGCLITTESDDEPIYATSYDGVVVVDWTIDGSKDASLCDFSATSEISIQIETTSGALVGEYVQDCDAFATSIDLPPGDYVGDAILIDTSGAQRTTAVDLGSFRIYGDDELIVPVDFPMDSFY